jgi:hypothetical protein
VRFAVVVTFPDSRKSRNAEGAKSEDVGSTQIVNVWSNPATVIELEQMITGLMISTNEDGQVRSFSRPAVVFMKVGHCAILGWHRGDVEVIFISDGLEGVRSGNIEVCASKAHLEITSNDEDVHPIPSFDST